MTKRVLRFAPSPTGYLHVGNIRTALFNYLQAKKVGAEFILRLDDTDKERSSQHFIDQIKRDLEWLGINWDRVEQQSLRIERYREVLNKFKEQKVVYECFETSLELELKRKKQHNQGKPPVYDRAALKLDVVEKNALRDKTDSYWRFLLSGETVTWRDEIAGEINVRTSVVSDPILVKGNGQFLYTLASVIDDSDFGVTDVVRGRDLLNGVPKETEVTQVQVAEALSEPVQQICEAVMTALESTPPDLAADIVDRGVMLTGGGALLGDLDLALREQTGLAISVADESLNCVALGTGKSLEFEKQLAHVIDYGS